MRKERLATTISCVLKTIKSLIIVFAQVEGVLRDQKRQGVSVFIRPAFPSGFAPPPNGIVGELAVMRGCRLLFLAVGC